MTPWIDASDAPEGIVFMTKVDNARQTEPRNVQMLKRQGNLWFVPDGSMYVYYTPTHYLPK